jgi:putative ABC transport system permease protein
MRNLIPQLLQDIRVHRMRAFLAIFGMAWGTVTVVLLMGFGAGMGAQIRKGFKGLGEHIVILWPGETSKPYKGLGTGRRTRFTEDDVKLLKGRVKEISEISPEFITSNIPIRYGKNLVTSRVVGVYPSYSKLRTLSPGSGRFINRLDLDLRRRVIFLGNEVAERIFGKEEAAGKRLMVQGIPFTVIGVMHKKIQSSCYGGMDKDATFIPFSTFKTIFGHTYLNDIVYRPQDPQLSPRVKKEVCKVLGAKHKFDPEDKEALNFWDTTEMEKMTTKISTGIEIFLAIVGALTLMIAGAAVANVMYVIVDERTREIGIRKAVGATTHNILTRFLSETLILALSGGIIGLILSFLIVGICSFIPEVGALQYIGKPIIVPVIPIVTVIILLIISMLAGLFPARRAARLKPVECLRYE